MGYQILTGVYEEISDEVAAARKKHPNWPAENTLRAVCIMMEEAGEAMKEAVKISGQEDDASMDNLRKEVLQTAAMCIRILERR